MDKLRMASADGVQDNILKIRELFPDCVTEAIDEATGKARLKIDGAQLLQNLSSALIGEGKERYRFTWPDKGKAILTANEPIEAALRPCREESVGRSGDKGGFDSENLYIEGDNLDVLKLLKETYLHKVKMIYIDPPYNTGNDFVYDDDFDQSAEEYRANSGQYDEQGNRLVQNTESNGRFHTDWLNMIYPRLKVARDFLSDDGVIFISIDDNEAANLKKICDEIFGEGNFIALYKWNKTSTPPSLSTKVRSKYEYVLCYEKNRSKIQYNGGITDGGDMPLLNGGNGIGMLTFKKESVYFPKLDGTYKAGNYDRVKLIETIKVADGRANKDLVLEGPFKWTQSTLDEEINSGTTFIVKSNKFAVRYIRLGERIKRPSDVISKVECGVGTNEEANKEVSELFGRADVMSYPKPSSLIKYLIPFAENGSKDSIILDFFSGSATTAHAVMQLNAEDGGRRKFIMVQLPEKCDEKSEAYKAGYKNICEIGKERIRRAGGKIKAESPLTTQDLDVGFRVLKLDGSNMEDIYYDPSQAKQNDVFGQVDNVKPDRSDLDLLFQAMLELGATLDSKIERITIEGKTVWNVADGYLIACFDTDVTDEIIEKIAKMEPQYALLRDSSLKTDSTVTNFEQIFKQYAPNAVIKIL